jgi:spore maturation protein CgeB
MKVLGLWVCDYYSGSSSERFRNPILNIGHELKVIPLEKPGMEAELLKTVEEWKPDFLFHVPYGATLRPEILKFISYKTYTVTIAWNGDDEWQFATDEGHKQRIQDYNYCVTTDERALEHYRESGYERVFLSHWGYSPKDWRQGNGKKSVDVYFCGARTPERDRYIRDVKDAGLPIVFEGPGYSKQKIDLPKMVKNYQRARIGLNFTLGIKKDHVYTQVKARNFEIPATGTFQLSEQSRGLDRFFLPGQEIETFKNSEELIKKIKLYLREEKRREEIAAGGHAAVKKFTYENALRPIFEAAKRVEVK